MDRVFRYKRHVNNSQRLSLHQGHARQIPWGRSMCESGCLGPQFVDGIDALPREIDIVSSKVPVNSRLTKNWLLQTKMLAARLRHDADLWPGCLEALRPDRLGFVVIYGACDNHVFALYPVCGGSHAV